MKTQEELKEMLSDLDESLCRLNLKIQECAEAGITGYIAEIHTSHSSISFSKDTHLSIAKAEYVTNLLNTYVEE